MHLALGNAAGIQSGAHRKPHDGQLRPGAHRVPDGEGVHAHQFPQAQAPATVNTLSMAW